MSNLRQMVDGVGSLTLNATPDIPSNEFRLHQDVIIRRSVSRTGPRTSEVMVGRILAMEGTTCTVSVKKAGGALERKVVNVKDLSPVTQAFKSSSIQFSPAYRGRL